MSHPRLLSAVSVAVLATALGSPVLAAPSHGSSSAGARSNAVRSVSTPHHSSGGNRHQGGHGGHGYRGWGWGIGLGVPLALGWYDPWWGLPYYSTYPTYGYAPVYRGYAGNACEQDEDCWRARMAPAEPAAPTTQVPPAIPGEADLPVERPLHLNYCDAAKAWFPQVRSCPGGWRMVRPSYN
jgi:hypothetical protein